MKMEGPAKRLRIYIGESDRYQGRSLYNAIVLKARELGLGGATVLRGIEGYGADSRIHAARLLDLSTDLPVIIEIIDRADRIKKLLAFVEEVVQKGLVTLDDVEVIRYAHGDGKLGGDAGDQRAGG